MECLPAHEWHYHCSVHYHCSASNVIYHDHDGAVLVYEHEHEYEH